MARRLLRSLNAGRLLGVAIVELLALRILSELVRDGISELLI